MKDKTDNTPLAPCKKVLIYIICLYLHVAKSAVSVHWNKHDRNKKTIILTGEPARPF